MAIKFKVSMQNEQSFPCHKIDLVTKKRIERLQKRKDAGPINSWVEAFIVDVLYGDQWEANHLIKLSIEDRKNYILFLEGALNLLTFDDRDKFIEKIHKVLSNATINNIWEVEHVSIINAFDSITREKNRFAALCEVSQKTGYTQKTISKHIDEYFNSPHYNQSQKEMLLLRERLLSRCYLLATGGNMKAAKLFLEATSNSKTVTCINTQHNNFTQVNNLTITEEQINGLPDDKKEQMKEILHILSSTITFK